MTHPTSADPSGPRQVVVVLDAADLRLGGIPGSGKSAAVRAVLAARALGAGWSVSVHDSTKENRS